MLIVLAAQAMNTTAGVEINCLAPLDRAEQRQDNAARASEAKAGNLPILMPDDDQLPVGAPDDFKPQLVILSYRMGLNGRVSDCSVDATSKISVFNLASCNLLREHYRISPGSPPSKHQRIAVSWTPRAIRPERRMCDNNHGTVPVSEDRWVTSAVFSGSHVQDGAALAALDVGSTGRIERCTILSANIDKGLQKNLCETLVKSALVLPAVDEQGNFVSARLTNIVRFVSLGY